MARPATARAPIPEPTLAPLLAWMGVEPLGEAPELLLAVEPAPAVVGTPGTTGAVGVGGLAGTVVATETVFVPEVKLQVDVPMTKVVEDGQ